MGRKLSRTSSSRLALFRSLARNLIEFGAIEISYPKAKETTRFVDKVVRVLKQGGIVARRRATALLADKRAEKRLFTEILPRFGGRKSGFTKITRMGVRRGDGVTMVKLEWAVGKEKVEPVRQVSTPKKEKHSH